MNYFEELLAAIIAMLISMYVTPVEAFIRSEEGKLQNAITFKEPTTQIMGSDSYDVPIHTDKIDKYILEFIENQPQYAQQETSSTGEGS